MAFGISYSSGADRTPIIKYDARAGRVARIDRKDGVNGSTDITNNFKALMDMECVEQGWIAFSDTGPDFALALINTPTPAKPSERHKQGVRIMLKLASECAGNEPPIRELATTASVSMKGLDRLHDEFLAKRQGDKLPIVTLKETVPITVGQGAQKSTNYEPVFEIVGWADRPADMAKKGEASAEVVPFKAQAAPPATGATKVSAPTAASADFG